MFGSFSIGLNPELEAAPMGSNYWPVDAAGLVHIIIGNNILEGGANRTQSYLSFPVVNATVSIDGNEIVKDGKLIFN